MTDAQACQVLLDRLLSGASVRTVEIYSCVDGYTGELLKQQLNELREQRKWYNGAKAELSEYTKLLRVADLLYNRAEKLRNTSSARRVKRGMFGKHVEAGKEDKLYAKATSFYEDALERLAELTSKRSDLLSILDRDFDFYAPTGTEVHSADAESMPRIHCPLQDADSLKISCLRSAITAPEITASASDVSEMDAERLKSMLKKLKK